MRASFMLLLVGLLAAGVEAKPRVGGSNRLTLVQANCAGRCTCTNDANCGPGGTCTGGVCVAGDPTRTACMRDAECGGNRTCAPQPHPCSASFRFTTGSAALLGARQPAPTRDPKQQRAGDVRFLGMSKGAEPFTGTLQGQVVYRTTFGGDANGNCPLANLQFETPSLVTTVTCVRGKCKGRVLPVFPLPGVCADTPITSEFVSMVVWDDVGSALAVPGTTVAPGRDVQ